MAGVGDRGKGRRPMCCRTLAYALPIFLLNGAFAEYESTEFLFTWHETSDHGPRLDEQENSGRGEGSPGGEGSPAREARGEEAGRPRGTCKVSAKHSNNAPRPSELSNLRKAAPKEAGGTGVRGRILRAAVPIFSPAIGVPRGAVLRSNSAKRCAGISGPISPKEVIAKNIPPLAHHK